MKAQLILTCLLAGILSLAHDSTQYGADDLQVGSSAPTLNGKDASGRPLNWASHTGMAIILYFHSGHTHKGDNALAQLNKALVDDKELASKSIIYVVLDDESESAALRTSLRPCGVDVRVLLSPDHAAHDTYGVIVYPTAYVFAADRVIVAIARGFGPLLSFDVTSAAHLAAGIIDAQEYRKLRGGRLAIQKAGHSKVSGTKVMARRLVESGKDEMALAVVRKSLSEDAEPRALAVLLVRMLLRVDQSAEASVWIQRLAAIPEDVPELTLLRAQLAVTQGRLGEAEVLLKPLEENNSQVRYLRGQTLERRGSWQAAASQYREALDSLLIFE